MQYRIKPFSDLSTQEFYAIAKLRIAVFVVEQTCPFQEIDDDDAHAVHTWLEDNQEIVGYARIIEQDTTVILGRVLIHPRYRGNKWAHQLVDNALSAIHTMMPGKPVQIDAQAHLQDFYAKHGFIAVSTAFLLDNILHVRMEKPAGHAARGKQMDN